MACSMFSTVAFSIVRPKLFSFGGSRSFFVLVMEPAQSVETPAAAFSALSRDTANILTAFVAMSMFTVVAHGMQSLEIKTVGKSFKRLDSRKATSF